MSLTPPTQGRGVRVAWQHVDTVLLDMDGTLLDLRFDNHFWLEHLPRRYAECHGLSEATAREVLLARYRAVEGTLAWYCVEHWTHELGLDVAELKREVQHLIGFLPHAFEFLDALRRQHKRVVLATNAHPRSLALKAERTGLAGHFDTLVSAHALGAPKESPLFWEHLQARIGYAPARSLFVDDSARILRAARDHGHIGQLLQVLRPDSGAPPRPAEGFPAIHDFSELLPLV